MGENGSVRNGFGVCGWCKLTKFVEHYGIVSMVALNGCHQVEVVSSFSCIKIIFIVVLGGLRAVTNSLLELGVPT